MSKADAANSPENQALSSVVLRASDLLEENLAMSMAAQAIAFDVSDREFRRWRKGTAWVPGPVAAWMGKVAAFLEQNPMPLPPRGEDI